ILSEVEQMVDHIGILADGKLGYEGEIPRGADLEELFMNVIKETAGR
ncbi:MAG: lantibiotic ABC transporter ATP-binding protein, partial [Lachnoclostridium sp.]|nr:lantibiotic ABC transporter ATP-binding protein [Lachnoclostridium sp.]